MRALFSFCILIALVFVTSVDMHVSSSALTTTVSAWAAPHLGAPSGYIRPSIAATVQEHQQHIQYLAHTYNHPQLSGMSDTEFAAVMVAILYTEQLGWLEDVLPVIRTVTPLYQRLQVTSNEWFGTNFSVWPANLRPSVVDEIVAEQRTHQLPGSYTASPHSIMHLAPVYTRMANAPDTAITLLAANLERGIYRAAATGIPVDSQVLFAWHNAGIVDPAIISTNRSLQQYIERASIYHTAASRMFVVAVMCPTPQLIAHPHINDKQ